MIDTATELDFSVLEELDFAVPCGLSRHGEHPSCDTGPAVWIAEMEHECDSKIMPVCDKFKRVMEDIATRHETHTAECGHTMPFEEFFKILEKL